MQKLQIQNLNYKIPFGKTIFQNLNLELDHNKTLGVLCHNGTGKSTLMDLILGSRRPTSGSIKFLEEKESICLLSQDVTINKTLSINEFLILHSSIQQSYSVAEEKYLLNTFGLSKNQKVGSLTLGQQKKLQIVAGFSTRPKLILLDEMTDLLDFETRSIFFDELKRVQKDYSSSIVIASNIVEDLLEISDEILFIKNSDATLHRPHEIAELFNLDKIA